MKRFLLSLLLLAALPVAAQFPLYPTMNSSYVLQGFGTNLFNANTNLLVAPLLNHFLTPAAAAGAYQPLAANLSTWAGVTPSANGQSLVSAANYASMRTLLSLGNVDNTSDANKPISTATQAALDTKLGTSGNGSGLTALNASQLASGTVPDARFPATLPAASGVNLTALNASNLGSGTVPDARFPATLPAVSGANLTGLTKSQVGLGSVDNTADLDKPVSTAAQAALDALQQSLEGEVASKLPTSEGTAISLAGTTKNLTRIQQVFGTIANGGTLTINPSTNFNHATFSGATGTIATTRDLVDGESVEVNVFNTAGAQVISVPSSYRHGATAVTTTVTNDTQHTLTWIAFSRVNGTNYIATLGDTYDPSGGGSFQAANANLDDLASEGSTGTGAFVRESAATSYTISGEADTADDTVTTVWESSGIDTNLTFTAEASVRAGGPTNIATFNIYSAGYRLASDAALFRATFDSQIDLTKTNHTTATLATNAWFALSSSNTLKLFAKGLATESMRWHARGEFLSTTNGPATEGASTTLFEDDFEDGTLDKWTVGAGTVVTTTSNPLKDTYSMVITDPSSGTWYATSDTYSATAPNEIWIAFEINGTANPAAVQNTFRLYDASANSLGLFTVSASGTMRMVVEGGSSPTYAGTFSTTPSTGTKVMIRYTADTGSGARMTTYFTSGSDWDGGRSSTVGSALNVAAYHAVFLNATGNTDYRFDSFRVSTEVIPWNWAD